MQRRRGRPRGPNYARNLRYRERAQQKRTQPATASALPPTGQERIHTLSKALFRMVNSDRVAGKQPVYSQHELEHIGDGVLLRHPQRPTLDDLRNLSISNSLIGAIHRVRADDLGQFARPFKDKEGYTFELAEAERKPTRPERQLMLDAVEWFEYLGDRTEGGAGRDRFQTVFQFMVRDLLSIDAVAFWMVRNKRRNLTGVRYLDPATLFPVDERRGFRGDTSVAYVQIVNGEYVETFGADEILVRHMNQLSDVRYRGTGLSPTEVAVMEIVALINGLKYNRQRFSNNPPQGFLSAIGTLPAEALEELQIQWENMFANNENNFRIPILSSESEIKWTPLNIQSDLAFEKLLQWMTTFVLICFGMDQAELGLRLMGSNSLSESSPDGRITNSMTRAKKAMLAFIADVGNEIRDATERFEPLVFTFKGVEPEDEDKRIDRDTKRVKAFEFADEIRASRDLPTLGEAWRDMYKLTDEEYEKIRFAGAPILDPTWMQAGGALLQQLTQPAEGGDPYGDEDGVNADGPDDTDYQAQPGDEDGDFDPDSFADDELPAFQIPAGDSSEE